MQAGLPPVATEPRIGKIRRICRKSTDAKLKASDHARAKGAERSDALTSDRADIRPPIAPPIPAGSPVRPLAGRRQAVLEREKMTDYFEIDFLGVETAKSGDAITLRYSIGGITRIHIVDGGYLGTSDQIIEHLKTYYGAPTFIDAVVLTHSDRDHANGLRKILETYDVGCLYMNRPWLYAEELLARFETYTSASALYRKLREVYAAVVELEDIALRRGIPISDAFQGAAIGSFMVMAPSRTRYLDLIVASQKTPEAAKAEGSARFSLLRNLVEAAKNFIAAAWGEERFPADGTSSENEMSLVQYLNFGGEPILLTGDAGREALTETIAYAPMVGLNLPGLKMVQVPHHGGRHNVSSEILDALLGPKFDSMPANTLFSAICSSAKEDKDHPRKVVKRAFLHRGAHFSETEGKPVHWSRGISRPGWTSIPQADYPTEMEE